MMFTLLVGLIGCNQENEFSEVQPKQTLHDEGASITLNLINAFREQTCPSTTRGGLSDLTILEIKKDSFAFKKRTPQESTSRSNESAIEYSNIYTVTFKANDQKGFAIASPDSGINQVLLYCENGSLADTAYIEGLKMAVESLPYACAAILTDHENNNMESRAGNLREITIENFVGTAWGQDAPYNSKCPKILCSGESVRARAGHVAVATAQAIAYLENMFIMEPSGLIATVAEGCQTEFGCDYSYSKTSLIAEYLENWRGYNVNMKKPTFMYRKSSSFNHEQLYSSLSKRLPVIAGGVAKKGNGYEWLYTGIKAQLNLDGTLNKITHLYCNWGYNGGNGNCWYSEAEGYNQPRDKVTKEPISGERPYNSSNTYIYFLSR